jgi:hypothetical protein
MIDVHKSLDQPVFMHAWGAVNRCTKEDEKGPMVKNGVADTFPMKMVRYIHGTEVSVSFSDFQDRVVADRGPGSLFGKA